MLPLEIQRGNEEAAYLLDFFFKIVSFNHHRFFFWFCFVLFLMFFIWVMYLMEESLVLLFHNFLQWIVLVLFLIQRKA